LLVRPFPPFSPRSADHFAFLRRRKDRCLGYMKNLPFLFFFFFFFFSLHPRLRTRNRKETVTQSHHLPLPFLLFFSSPPFPHRGPSPPPKEKLGGVMFLEPPPFPLFFFSSSAWRFGQKRKNRKEREDPDILFSFFPFISRIVLKSTLRRSRHTICPSSFSPFLPFWRPQPASGVRLKERAVVEGRPLFSLSLSPFFSPPPSSPRDRGRIPRPLLK